MGSRPVAEKSMDDYAKALAQARADIVAYLATLSAAR